MCEAVYRDPTFNAVVRAEQREKSTCGLCVRGERVLSGYKCKVNKRYPSCQYGAGGFELKRVGNATVRY